MSIPSRMVWLVSSLFSLCGGSLRRVEMQTFCQFCPSVVYFYFLGLLPTCISIQVNEVEEGETNERTLHAAYSLSKQSTFFLLPQFQGENILPK